MLSLDDGHEQFAVKRFRKHDPLAAQNYSKERDGLRALQGSRLVPRMISFSDKHRIRIARGRRRVEYITLLFDQHEIISADGLLVESYLPRPYAMELLDELAKATLRDACPIAFSDFVETFYPSARKLARVSHMRAVLSAARNVALGATVQEAGDPAEVSISQE